MDSGLDSAGSLTRERRRPGVNPPQDDVPPAVYPPPQWMGRVLLTSMLVALNAHLFVTAFVGVDQYSFFTADLGEGRWIYPVALGNKPYPLLLSAGVSVVLAVVAYLGYRLIWWFLGNRAALGLHPFAQYSVAIGIPMSVAMAPSIVLSYIPLTTFYLSVGAVLIVVMSITGMLKHPEVQLDRQTRRDWFLTAFVGVCVLTLIGLAVMLYFLVGEHEPPVRTFIWDWSEHWDQHWQEFSGGQSFELFNARMRAGVFLTGIVTIAYLLVAVGGPMLYALSRYGSTPRSASHSTNIAVTPPHGTEPTATIYQPLSADEEQHDGVSSAEPDGPTETVDEWQSDVLPPEEPHDDGESAEAGGPAETVDEWRSRVLQLLEEMNIAGGGNRDYVAVVAGKELAITEQVKNEMEYGPARIVDDADLVVLDGMSPAVWRRQHPDAVLERDRSYNAGANNDRTAIFALLCIYARHPNREFTNGDLNGLVAEAVGSAATNISDNISRLLNDPKYIPLERTTGQGMSKLREGTKVVIVFESARPLPAVNPRA